MFKNIFKKIKEIPVKKLVLFTILFFLSLIIVLSYTRKSAIKAYVNTNDFTNNYVETNNMISGNLSYTNKLIEYQNNNYKFINKDIELDNELYNGNQVLNNDLDYGDIVSNYIDDYGGSKVFLLDYQNSLKITINEIESGVHYLAVDYYELSNSIDNNQISILINGEVPFHESNTVVLSSYWQFESEEFKLDRYENEIQPGTIKDIKWRNQALYDYYGQHPGYYGFYLNEGDVIEIKSVNNELLIGSVYLKSYQEISDYQTYLNKYSHAELIDSKIEIAARNMAD